MAVLSVAGVTVPVRWVRAVTLAEMAAFVEGKAAEADRMLSRAIEGNRDAPVVTVVPGGGFVRDVAAAVVPRLRTPLVLAAITGGTLLASLGVLAYAEEVFRHVPATPRTESLHLAYRIELGCCAVVSALIFLVVASSIRGGRLEEADRRFEASCKLADAASVKVVAASGRLYHLRSAGQGGPGVRQVHYDAVGDCFADNGTVRVHDLAGAEIITLQGVNAADARRLAEYVNERARRARGA